MKGLKIVFMGTPDFALPSLQLLQQSNHDLVGVVTRPDRPRGRGKQVHFSPVKNWALENDAALCQPEKINDSSFWSWLREVDPDLIVTVAYGRLLSQKLLSFPPLGCINLHASYLPAYRGSAPIHRAVIEGASYSGVSIIDLTKELDAGDIIIQEKEPIGICDTAGALHDRLAERGAKLLVRAIDLLAVGTAVKKPQDAHLASYAPPLEPADECLDWNKSALEIYNQVRGLNPWPGAYSTLRGKRLKVWRAVLPGQCGSVEVDDDLRNDGKALPGTILSVGEDSLTVATGKGSITLIDVQPAGKQKMDAGSFCCGYRVAVGERLNGE